MTAILKKFWRENNLFILFIIFNQHTESKVQQLPYGDSLRLPVVLFLLVYIYESERDAYRETEKG